MHRPYLISLFLFLFFTQVCVSAPYEVVDLTPQSLGSSIADSINDHEEVAGRLAHNSSGFLWAQNGLRIIDGVYSMTPLSVGASGALVGLSFTGDPLQAFMFDGGVRTVIEPAPFMHLSAINNSNNFIIGDSTIWNWDGRAARSVGSIAVTGGSFPVDINNANTVVGALRDESDNGVYVWSDGRTSTLGTDDDTPVAINDSGEILANRLFENEAARPVVFRAAGANTILPNFGGDRVSRALDLNNAGAVVGFSSPTSISTQRRAILWEGGVAADLNELIDVDSGWILTEARAINQRGSIVGVGILNGERKAFLLRRVSTPAPTPTATSGTPSPTSKLKVHRPIVRVRGRRIFITILDPQIAEAQIYVRGVDERQTVKKKGRTTKVKVKRNGRYTIFYVSDSGTGTTFRSRKARVFVKK